jgi:hypothetical protein
MDKTPEDSEVKEIKIRELNIYETIRPLSAREVSKGGYKIVVIGRPGSGKSALISDLIYRKSNIFPVAMVLNGTEENNKHYENLGIPPCAIYNELNKDAISSFIERQKLARQYLENPWALLVIDDCMEDPKLWNDPVFQGLVKNGRHFALNLIIGLQYCLDIKPAIRMNLDGAFIFREPNIKTRKSLYENFAGIIPDQATFNALMDEITDDYTALYINNSTQSNKMSDCVFWYKSRPVPKDFKFGCSSFWQFNNTRLKPELLQES